MSTHTAFTGSVPRTYHTYLGPLVFEDYAKDLVDRLRPAASDRILELACGTGIVTRHIARAMPRGATLVATDLNDAMLDVARKTVGDDPRVGFQRADACALPFAEGSFDALACQYGVMFFPDKVHAMREARRVLAPGGRYLFNVWDSLEHNSIARTVHETVTALFPDNPPTFLAQTPYGWSDRAEIERTVRAGGFTRFTAQTVELPCAAPCAEDAARGFIDGTPLAIALQERGVTNAAPIRQGEARALAERFGDRPCRAPDAGDRRDGLVTRRAIGYLVEEHVPRTGRTLNRETIMGITIHYSGRAKSDNAVTELLSVAQTFAAARGWKFALFDDPLGTSPNDDPPPIGWAGPSRGVAITPHPKCETVLLDFNTANELSGFTKTQYAPFRVHEQIVELLRVIEPFMEELTVLDESGLWESGDQAAARAQFKHLDDAMDRLAGSLREHGCEVEEPGFPIEPEGPDEDLPAEDQPYG